MPLLRRADRQVAGTAGNGVGQDPVLLAEGMTAPPVGRAEEGVHGQAGRGEDVHGSGIADDGKGGPLPQGDELPEIKGTRRVQPRCR